MSDLAERDLLARVGETLFGPRWQSDVARVLDVDSRRVREWLSGSRSIPPGIWADLATEADSRAADLRSVADELRKRRDPERLRAAETGKGDA